MEPVAAYARLNARIMPLDRGELFEDPLGDALAESGYGEIAGGGTMQSASGEIEYCGIDVDIFDIPQGVPFICQFLTEHGAPRGSVLQYEADGQDIEVPFGEMEGLAIYLNGTDLPDEVYEQCDVNDLYDEINRLLTDHGVILGHWQGPTETALYLYGPSAEEMQRRIAHHLATYPLCQKARVVKIA
jgi:hypothetical protein